MSSTAVAPWRDTFNKHLSEHMDSPEFVLSTLHTAPEGSPTPYIPKARYCIHRGMFSQLPPNKHNTAPSNPSCYDSDMPTFTTDSRMAKVPELFQTSKGIAGRDGRTADGDALDREKQSRGSGGGGPVEAVWWVKDVMVQWRISGECFIIGPDIEGDGEEASGVRTAKSALLKRMRVTDEEKKSDWSWQREITAHFGNLSPGMRGSFKQPPPGRPQSEPYDDSKEKMGEKITGLDDEVAREHFRVAVIRPREVEMLDLNPESARRERYTYDEKEDKWECVTTWP